MYASNIFETREAGYPFSRSYGEKSVSNIIYFLGQSEKMALAEHPDKPSTNSYTNLLKPVNPSVAIVENQLKSVELELERKRILYRALATHYLSLLPEGQTARNTSEAFYQMFLAQHYIMRNGSSEGIQDYLIAESSNFSKFESELPGLRALLMQFRRFNDEQINEIAIIIGYTIISAQSESVSLEDILKSIENLVTPLSVKEKAIFGYFVSITDKTFHQYPLAVSELNKALDFIFSKGADLGLAIQFMLSSFPQSAKLLDSKLVANTKRLIMASNLEELSNIASGVSVHGELEKTTYLAHAFSQERIEEIYARLNHFDGKPYSKLALGLEEMKRKLTELVADEKTRKKYFTAIEKLESLEQASIEIEFYSPSSLFKGPLEELASMRKRAFDNLNWQHSTPAGYREHMETDVNDWTSYNILVRIGGELIGCSRIAYPQILESNLHTAQLIDWLAQQPFLVSKDLRFAEEQPSESTSRSEKIDFLKLALESHGETILNSALSGTIAETQRFLINEQFFDNAGLGDDRIAKLTISLMVVNILFAATCGLLNHNCTYIAFDQAPKSFTDVLTKTLGSFQNGGGFQTYGVGWTRDDKVDGDGNTPYSETYQNLIFPQEGLTYAKQHDPLASMLAEGFAKSLQEDGFTSIKIRADEA